MRLCCGSAGSQSAAKQAGRHVRTSRHEGWNSEMRPVETHTSPLHTSADSWIDSFQPTAENRRDSGLGSLLPRLRMETFDGDQRTWPSFIECFKAFAHDATPVAAQRMAMLKSCMSSRVRASIAQTLHSPNMYVEALRTFRRRYGNPQLIARSYLNDLMNLAVVRDGDLDGIRELSSNFRGTIVTLSELGFSEESEAGTNMELLMMKLPPLVRDRWGEYLADLLTN